VAVVAQLVSPPPAHPRESVCIASGAAQDAAVADVARRFVVRFRALEHRELRVPRGESREARHATKPGLGRRRFSAAARLPLSR